MSMLRLWLSLLMLGIAFWTIGQLITQQILGRTYQTPRYVITSVQSEDSVQPTIAAIRVEINNESSTAEAKVVSDDPDWHARKLRFALTIPEEIEQAIAQELNIPLQEVSNLVHYKVHSHFPR